MKFNVIAGIFIIFIAMTHLFDWTKSKVRLTVKKGIDCTVPLFFYIILVCAWNQIGNGKLIMNIISILSIIVLLSLFISQVVIWNKRKGVTKAHFVFVILNVFICICVTFAFLNFLIYMNFPWLYEAPSNMSVCELGFEFLYYTFTLMLTYSDSSICVIHHTTKLLQMIEISVFYITIGVYITDLIERYKTFSRAIAEDVT